MKRLFSDFHNNLRGRKTLKSGKISRTAEGVAVLRALETNRTSEDRLFSDPFAYILLKRS